jgi:predicted CXXCH cytochrome family protein
MRVVGVLVFVAALASVAGASPAVDQKEACLVCHDDLSASIDARVSHPPARDGECSACHNPHVSRFGKLLKDHPGPLCATCHTELEEVLDREVVHPPVAEASCGACHEPHGGKHAGLLVSEGTDLCGECHADVAKQAGRAVVHPPFEAGECGSCHEPHASDFRGLILRSGGEVCTPCHAVNARFTNVHRGYPVERANCQQCHDPHASAREGLFRSHTHPPFESGDCTVCHGAPDGDDPFAPSARMDVLCGECHEEQVRISREAPFPHVSEGGGACVACHNPHTADGAGFLKQPTETLCLSCHDPGGASSGEEGRFAGHAELSCTTCHAPHGSSGPVLFEEGSIELCGTCHSHQHSVAHPMGEGSKDPRNGQPVDCLSCHGVHNAPYPKYLHRASDRELCLACHKQLTAGGRP